MEKISRNDMLENVQVTAASSDGKAIARVNNQVVFVEGGVPGDIADLFVYRTRKNFAEARVSKIVQPSPDRVEPFCSHFGTCGGCKWQHMTYEMQLKFKAQQVEDALIRIGKLDVPPFHPILGSAKIRHYRNRLDFSCSNKQWLTREELNTDATTIKNVIGFHVPGRFDKILDIDRCYLQEDLSNEIRIAVKKFADENGITFFDVVEQTGFLRDLIIRSTSTGEWMVILIFHEEIPDQQALLLDYLHHSFPQLTSLQYIINTKRNDTIFDLPVHLWKGRDHIFEEMEGLKFKISAKSFYQTNSWQAYELYKITRDFAQLNGQERVYDLYTGTGTIANFIARQAKEVIGIDNVADAIEDAKFNSENNGITNTKFYAGDLHKIVNPEFIREHGRADVIITDPPRSGMHPEAVRQMAEMAPKKIVYVSCNPSTQARDLALLADQYKIDAVQPVDMFPHTSHVENVVLLTLRSSE